MLLLETDNADSLYKVLVAAITLSSTLSITLLKVIEWAIRTKHKDPQTSQMNGKSGSQPVSFWEQKIEEAVNKGVAASFTARNEHLREMMRDEFSYAARLIGKP